MTSNVNHKVGDKVIYLPTYGAKPKVTNITKVTPSGQVIVDGAAKRFKYNFGGKFSELGRGSAQVWEYNETKLDELEKHHNDTEASKQMKRNLEAARQQQVKERKEKEMAETIKFYDNQLPIVSLRTLPDGKRFVVLNLLTNPAFTDKNYEMATVVITDAETYDMASREEKKIKVVRARAMWFSNKSSGFSTSGDDEFPNDVEALWYFVDKRFHDNW